MTGIGVIDKALPDELIDEVERLIAKTGWRYGWRSNNNVGYAHWNQDFGKAGPDNGLDITDRLPDVLKAAWDYLQSVYFPNTTLIRCYANSHTFGVEGYPHTDSSRNCDTTMLIYMNRKWLREWGGETTVYDGDVIRYTELPKFNKGFAFNGADWHAARAVSRVCPELRITLMFKFAPKDCDTVRDGIQRLLMRIGANKIPHSKRNLMKHLLGVYDALKAAGCSETVCKAGGLHSVFGTNYFTTVAIADEGKKEVEDLVGLEAMKLIELFSTINRPQVLTHDNLELALTAGGTVLVTEQQLEDLKDIECANLADQSALAKHPSLQSRWTQKLKKE